MSDATENLAGVNSATTNGAVRPAGAEQRVAQRFALMLRTAKLINGDGEYLCIVRDVSETGLKLRLFHPLPGDRQYTLENGSGQRFDVEAVWEREGEAGFRFVERIEVSRFLAETEPFPKRPIRIRVDHPLTVIVAGARSPATLLDLSREGARILTDSHMAMAQQFRIEAADLPELEATVCWRRQPVYGVAFRQVLSLSELASCTLRMNAQAQQRNTLP